MSMPELQSTGIEMPIKHIIIDKRKKAFFNFVHADYLRDPHESKHMGAIVTHHSVPIERNGEVLTIGLVPPERRFAIGKVYGDRAEVLNELDFREWYKKMYVTGYVIRGQQADDPNIAPVPDVVEFVSVREDPNDESKLIPLGMASQNVEERTHFWSEQQGRMVPVGEALVGEDAEDPRDARIRELESQLQATVVKDEPVKVSEDDPTHEHAPCGSLVRKGYINQHVAKCKNPECTVAA